MSQPEPATAGIQSAETEVGSVFVSNYPPFSFWSKDQIPEVHQRLAVASTEAQPLGLYLHIPFCRKRCKFCYFKVYTDKDSQQIRNYTEAMAQEAELYAQLPAIVNRPLRFVYFGGGTPSYISVKHLNGLVERMRAALSWDAVEEVTFECEPGTLTRTKLEAIRAIGVSRLSLGVENFNDDILRENGRAHLSPEIYRVLPWIHELDFNQLNIDLIAGMVGETWDTWKDSIERTIDANPDAVTIYQMELPFNAIYSAQLMHGELATPVADWETKRAWNDYAFDRLAEAGYEPSSAYTVVKKGSGARFVYRDALWHGHDLLGVGVSSFSHLDGIHFQNTSSWGSYLEQVDSGQLPIDRAFSTQPRERLIREMILQLKLGSLQPQYFDEKFGVNILDEFRSGFDELKTRGMATITDEKVDLTRQGLLQVDSLLPTFYDQRYHGARYT